MREINLKDKKIDIGGVFLNNFTERELLERVEEFLKEDKQHYLVTPNPEFVVYAQKDNVFKEILNNAEISLPDGVGLVIASVIKYHQKIKRLPGTDMVEFLVQKLASQKIRTVFFGGLDDAALRAAEKMRKKYGNENIFGLPDGTSLEVINDINPQIVFVGIGSPKQEKWIVENMNKIPSGKIFMGVGGAFDFISGKVKRAPKIIREIGLEWLFRLVLQPFRWRRASRATFVFMAVVLKDAFQIKKNK
jgi:N-acetylglucosaminyldiphosphoundecaprenol N-acetyl-beta-D-mannosaminyltransferase